MLGDNLFSMGLFHFISLARMQLFTKQAWNFSVTCEVHVFLNAVCSFICLWFGRTVRLTCVALLLLLAAHTKSIASSPNTPDKETLLPASTRVSFPAPYEHDSNGIQVGGRNKENLIRTATFTATSSSHANSIAAPATAAAVGESPSQSVGTEKRITDWNGVWIDTGMLLGSQFVAAGIIYAMPQSVSSWSADQKKNTFKHYGENFVDPVWDKDKFYINYILHPYWGATYYIRGRERGLDYSSAFVYSTLMSAMYEFGIECFFEKPSIQDLFVTPVAGSLLGALIFEPWRESIKRKQDLSWYDHTVLLLTDPVGILSLGFEKVFGIKSTIMVDYSVPQMQKLSAGSAVASKSSRFGVVMQFPLN
jgi:hypothetical protein